jgi:hypothetical protein
LGRKFGGGDLERDREWTSDGDCRGGGPPWIGSIPVSRIGNVQVVEIGRRGTGGQGHEEESSRQSLSEGVIQNNLMIVRW